MSSLLLKGVIRHGRVEVDEPIDLPEGTKVVVTSGTTGPDDDPVKREEIARVLAAMHQLQPMEIPDDDVGADLDAWESKLNQHGIDNTDLGNENVFR